MSEPTKGQGKLSEATEAISPQPFINVPGRIIAILKIPSMIRIILVVAVVFGGTL